jgi:ABC-type molybdate transport system ATPase subunit
MGTPDGSILMGRVGSDQGLLQGPSERIWSRPWSSTLGAKSSTIERVTEMVTQDYVTRFAMQAANATNALAVLGRKHDKAEVDRNALIHLEANRVVINLSCDKQVGYANSVLVHVTNTARMHVPEALIPNYVEGLTNQVADLPTFIFIRVF